MCKLKQSTVVGRHSRATASVSTCWHARPYQEDVGPLHTVKASYGWKGYHSLKTETKKREAMFEGRRGKKRNLVLDLTDLRHL